MNTQTPHEESPTLDFEVKRLLLEMRTMRVSSDEYRKTIDNLSILCNARGIKSNRTVSMDTIVNVVASLAMTLLILNFEKTGVITSKAFGNIFKGGRG